MTRLFLGASLPRPPVTSLLFEGALAALASGGRDALEDLLRSAPMLGGVPVVDLERLAASGRVWDAASTRLLAMVRLRLALLDGESFTRVPATGEVPVAMSHTEAPSSGSAALLGLFEGPPVALVALGDLDGSLQLLLRVPLDPSEALDVEAVRSALLGDSSAVYPLDPASGPGLATVLPFRRRPA